MWPLNRSSFSNFASLARVGFTIQPISLYDVLLSFSLSFFSSKRATVRLCLAELRQRNAVVAN